MKSNEKVRTKESASRVGPSPKFQKKRVTKIPDPKLGTSMKTERADQSVSGENLSRHLPMNLPQRTTTVESIEDLIAFIRKIEVPPLSELAQTLLHIPDNGLAGGGRLTNKELVILVVEYLKELAQEHGWGVSFMDGVLWMYTGTHWKEMTDDNFVKLIGTLAERVGCPAATARDYQFRDRLFKQCKMEFRADELPAKAKSIFINLLNGTLEFNDGVPSLRGFSLDDHLRYQLQFNYDPDADCPIFHEFLERVQPDPSARDLLAEFMGWCFLKGLKLEKSLLLYGTGNNGKSVYFEIMCALLGPENVSHLDIQSLMTQENRFPLGSSLLNFCSELGGRWNPSIFKRLASGEPVSARRLWRNPYIMRDYAKLAFNTNVLPKAEELTNGFFKRFLIVPFPVVIPKEEIDPDLPRKIINAELSGVLNWVIRGMLRLNKNRRFSECASAEAAILDYIHENDTVSMFMEEQGLESSDEGKIGKSALHQGYLQFCRSNGLQQLAKNEFGKQLTDKHQIRDGKSGSERYWRIKRAVEQTSFSEISVSISGKLSHSS